MGSGQNDQQKNTFGLWSNVWSDQFIVGFGLVEEKRKRNLEHRPPVRIAFC